jgi:hypothetical protein
MSGYNKMIIPGYDAWKLRSPDEDGCPYCGINTLCEDCEAKQEYADGLGDYLLERKRDREMEEESQ